MQKSEIIDATFSEVHQLKEQGDFDEASDRILLLYPDHKDNLDVVWTTIQTLKGSSEHKKNLSDILDKAIITFPDHIPIKMEWAKYPGLLGELELSLKRMQEAVSFCSDFNGDNILFLTEQFILMRDLEKWDELVLLIENNWQHFIASDVFIILPAIIFTLSACGLHEKLIEYITIFKNKHLKGDKVALGIDLNNVLTTALAAVVNKTWMRHFSEPVKIISVGQNCLPAYITTRWGLNLQPLDFLPYDQSAFPGDSSAKAIESNFSIFDDITKFVSRPFGKHSRIVYHSETGVHFAHNPLPLTNNTRQLKDVVTRFQKRIEQFKNLSDKNKIFFVNFCGSGSPDILISSLKKKFGDNCNIIILNTTENYFKYDFSENISVINLPYPHDYQWNTLEHYTSDRGIAFEAHIIEYLKNKILSLTG